MQTMTPTMRWFGPQDTVKLKDVRQAGIREIVTALHEIAPGEIWPETAIRERQSVLREMGMEWTVVESLPVHEDIKRNRGAVSTCIENYKESIRNLATCGIHIITYNFMPVLDWIRTDCNYHNPDGTRTLAFNRRAFNYFDLFLLKRPGAYDDYTADQVREAENYGSQLSEEERKALFRQVLLGLPGTKEDFTAEQILELLEGYHAIDSEVFRANLISFLREITPVAESVGSKLAIHPDDPPYSLLGLPRILSTMDDAKRIFSAVSSKSNGLCYCTGSFGAHPDNDLPLILEEFRERIHFLHLRNVHKSLNGDFRESAHLEGDNPMEQIVLKILEMMNDRHVSLPMRPDHGFLHSMEENMGHYPGYSLVGRLKGLAELKGLEKGLMYKFQ